MSLSYAVSEKQSVSAGEENELGKKSCLERSLSLDPEPPELS